MDGPGVGRHVSTMADYGDIPDRVAEMGYTAFQIFSGNPRSWSTRRPPLRQLRRAGERCLELGMEMAIHTSYLINMCRPADSEKGVKSAALLRKDLQNTSDWGESCLGAVLHMGKLADMGVTEQVALQTYVDNLREILSTTPGSLILETGAGVRGEVGTSIQGLAEIWRGLGEYQDRVGFCIDTAHIWAAGYDISTRSGVRRYLREWDREIGVEQIVLIHFNDSGRELDSHVDCHANIGLGLIDLAGLGTLARWAARHRVPLVAETPGLVPPEAESDLIRSLARSGR